MNLTIQPVTARACARAAPGRPQVNRTLDVRQDGRVPLVLKTAIWAMVLSITVVGGYCVWAVAMGISLEVEVHEGEVLIDTQVFGEYYSSISRVRIVEIETGHTVWEIESTDGTSPMWYFTLQSGKNVTPENLRDFRTVVPRSGEPFDIVPGREYRVRVWGKTKLNRNSRRFKVSQAAAEGNATSNSLLNLPVWPGTALAGRVGLCF